MWIVETVAELRQKRRGLRGKVALVPTMGALHAGHQSLIERARAIADHVIVSIFVNPTQFGPNEDYAQYPRPVDRDMDCCERGGVDGVFSPKVEEVYSPQVPACEVIVPDLMKSIEGEHRPGHFAGVCRVVMKLLNMTQPNIACFGRKDFQQLRIVQAMVADLSLPVAIVECETVRETDGLAISSRNFHIAGEDRHHARGLFKALVNARMLVEQAGETDPLRVERSMHEVMRAYQVRVDYAVVRHPLTLTELDCIEPALTGGVVALVAGRVGNVRLIDNMILAEPKSAEVAS